MTLLDCKSWNDTKENGNCQTGTRHFKYDSAEMLEEFMVFVGHSIQKRKDNSIPAPPSIGKMAKSISRSSGRFKKAS